VSRPIGNGLAAVSALIALGFAFGAPAAWAQLPTTYTYDVHGRLITATTPSQSATYTYDNAGNRTQIAATAVTAPVAGPVTLSVNVNSSHNPVPINLSGATPTVIQLTAASHGTATVSGLSVSYTPTSGYVGADSFQYGAANTCCTSWATVSINVLNTFTTSLSSAYWTWEQDGGGTPGTTLPVVVTPSGGLPGYAYAWSYVSGDTAIAISSTGSNTVSWTRSPLPALNVTYTAVWQCQAWDSAGHTYINQVTVNFIHAPKQFN
jgi:YD repeat-containing protein